MLLHVKAFLVFHRLQKLYAQMDKAFDGIEIVHKGQHRA